jgi:SAM-dependent methyltransferase
MNKIDKPEWLKSPPKISKSFLWENVARDIFTLRRRAEDTLKFIGDDWNKPICDCGIDNPFKHLIFYWIKSIDKTDFDRDKFPGKWHTILCFELLEHLYNPLFFLEQARKALLPGGCIYLSTPYRWPVIFNAPHHFHEIPDDRIRWLFAEAGLKIVREGRVRFVEKWYQHIHGIRPILRFLFFNHARIYKLQVSK